jgi:ethanolamine utilization protein EutN/carbon dioxide concentrating mechanism protein CcmL
MVRGRVVLNSAVDSFRGLRLVILEPVTAANLAARNGLGGGTPLVAVDPLGAAEGQMVAFVEGREAANPWWPNHAPVDACCALIVESVDFRPEDRK